MPFLSRREMLASSGAGFGSLALVGLLGSRALGSTAPADLSPLAAKPAHQAGRAKSVIFLFMEAPATSTSSIQSRPWSSLPGSPCPRASAG